MIFPFRELRQTYQTEYERRFAANSLWTYGNSYNGQGVNNSYRESLSNILWGTTFKCRYKAVHACGGSSVQLVWTPVSGSRVTLLNPRNDYVNTNWTNTSYDVTIYKNGGTITVTGFANYAYSSSGWSYVQPTTAYSSSVSVDPGDGKLDIIINSTGWWNNYTIGALTNVDANAGSLATTPESVKMSVFFDLSSIHDNSGQSNALTVVPDGTTYPTISGGFLNLSLPQHKVTCDIAIGNDWTLDAVVNFPLPAANATVFSSAINKHVTVQANKLGTKIGSTFYDSGLNVTNLRSGLHRIVVVGTGSTTQFFVDGKVIGTVNAKATDNITAFGNAVAGGERVGSMFAARIFNRAKTSKEVTAECLKNDYVHVS